MYVNWEDRLPSFPYETTTTKTLEELSTQNNQSRGEGGVRKTVHPYLILLVVKETHVGMQDTETRNP